MVDSKNEWGRDASRFYYDVDYWIKRGYSEEDAALKILNTRKALSIPKTEEQKQMFSEIGKKNKEIFSQKSKDYWLNLDEETKTERFEQLKNFLDLAREKRSPSSFLFKPEYWMKKLDITEEDAKIIISKNSTRNLNYFIEKYGEDLGVIKFEEMKRKRRETWANKSEEDIYDHKEKIRKNAHVGLYNENTISKIKTLNFYLFYHINGVKFGLTKQNTLNKRWSIEFNYEELLFKEMTANDALTLENKIKKIFECSKNDILNTTEFIKCERDNPLILKIISGEI